MGVSGRRFFEGLHIDFLLHIDFENGCAIGDRIIFIFISFGKTRAWAAPRHLALAVAFRTSEFITLA